MDIPVVHQTNLLFADFFMIWIVESRWMKNMSVGRTFQFLGPIEKKKKLQETITYPWEIRKIIKSGKGR